MADRDPYRKLVSTQTAGRGRTISVYYSPLNLRHEVDYRGRILRTFPGVYRSSYDEAVIFARGLAADLRKNPRRD